MPYTPLLNQIANLCKCGLYLMTAHTFAHECPHPAKCAITATTAVNLEYSVHRVLPHHPRIGIKTAGLAIRFDRNLAVALDQIPLDRNRGGLSTRLSDSASMMEINAGHLRITVLVLQQEIHQVVDLVFTLAVNDKMTQITLQIPFDFITGSGSAGYDKVAVFLHQMSEQIGQRVRLIEKICVYCKAGNGNNRWLYALEYLVYHFQPSTEIIVGISDQSLQELQVEIMQINPDIPAEKRGGQPLQARGGVGIISAVSDNIYVNGIEQKLWRLQQKQLPLRIKALFKKLRILLKRL
ncbi:MAG: hypothetical protein V1791_02005 [Pseudomonadota bacterium]